MKCQVRKQNKKKKKKAKQITVQREGIESKIFSLQYCTTYTDKFTTEGEYTV